MASERTERSVMIKRIAAGEYVAVNTLPTVRFSRKAHDRWQISWNDGKAVIHADSKAEGIARVLDYATLADVVVANPLRIVQQRARS